MGYRIGGCVGEVEVRSSGELPRRKPTSTVAVNGGSGEVKANWGREAEGEEMGVLYYRRVDDFSEKERGGIEAPRILEIFYVFFPAKLCDSFTHEFWGTIRRLT